MILNFLVVEMDLVLNLYCRVRSVPLNDLLVWTVRFVRDCQESNRQITNDIKCTLLIEFLSS